MPIRSVCCSITCFFCLAENKGPCLDGEKPVLPSPCLTKARQAGTLALTHNLAPKHPRGTSLSLSLSHTHTHTEFSVPPVSPMTSVYLVSCLVRLTQTSEFEYCPVFSAMNNPVLHLLALSPQGIVVVVVSWWCVIVIHVLG